MKKTVLFAFALVAVLFTTAVSGQTTRPSGGTTGGAGNTSGAGSQAGSGAGAGSQAGGSNTPGAMVSYPKVYVATPGAAGVKPSRRLLAGNLFKGKNQGIDLTYDVIDAKGNAVKDAVAKEADGSMVIDAGKLKGKGFRLRVKGAGTAVEFYTI